LTEGPTAHPTAYEEVVKDVGGDATHSKAGGSPTKKSRGGELGSRFGNPAGGGRFSAVVSNMGKAMAERKLATALAELQEAGADDKEALLALNLPPELDLPLRAALERVLEMGKTFKDRAPSDSEGEKLGEATLRGVTTGLREAAEYLTTDAQLVAMCVQGNAMLQDEGITSEERDELISEWKVAFDNVEQEFEVLEKTLRGEPGGAQTAAASSASQREREQDK
jgi:hypothetical protein